MQRLIALILGTIALISGTTFAQQCPIEVQGAKVLGAHTAIPYLPARISVYWKNISQQNIVAARFTVATVNAFDEVERTIPDIEVEESRNVKPGKMVTGIWANGGMLSENAKIVAWPTKIKFKDGSIWQDENSCKPK